MKIFILSTSYPDKENPTANIFIFEQAKQLAKMGHEITVLHVNRLSIRKLFKKMNKKVSVIDDGFADRYTIQQKTYIGRIFPKLCRDRFVKNEEKLFLSAVKEKGKPDVLYAHFSRWAGYSGGIIAQKYHVPLVTLEHYSGFVKGKGNIPKILAECVRKTIEKSAYFLCVSQKLKQSIIKNIKPDKEIFVVPNMIDAGFQYQPPKKHDGFIFSAVGRLTPQKNYETLISAFTQAFSPEDKVYLRIGGDGELRNKLEHIVKAAGRQHQIKFLGILTREQTLSEYIGCDCFALSSAWETYGIVYREAMAVGRPIVTTNHGGFAPEEWHPEYGFMVPIKDVDAFAAAMKYIVENYKGYDGKLISKLCLNDCSPDRIGAKIEHFLLKAKEESI